MDCYSKECPHPFSSSATNTIQLVGWVQRDDFEERIKNVCLEFHAATPPSCCHDWTSKVITQLANAGVLEEPRRSDDRQVRRQYTAGVEGN